MCTLNDRSIANKFALFADNFYQCNADLFVKNETLLSDNDPVICNAIASPGFKLFSFPKSTCKGGGTLLLFIFIFFFNSSLGYYSFNTSTIILHTIKIESIRYSRTIIEIAKQT